MYSLKFIILLITVVVILEAKEENGKAKEIFKKCAEANGLDMKKMKDTKKMNDSQKEYGKSVVSKEFLCTQKCVWEELGFLSGTAVDTEKIKKSESMKKHIKEDKMDGYLKCIKPIKVKQCEDFAKLFECKKALYSKS